MSDFEYEVEDGKVTITGYTGKDRDVVVPDTIDGLPVTCIGDNAFCYCTGLTSITLPASITTIGYYAFSGCHGLTSITLPNSITTISVGAFKRCTSLTSINLGNSVNTIGRWRAAWALDPEAPVFEARAEEEAKKETYISPFDRRSYRYNMGQKGRE